MSIAKLKPAPCLAALLCVSLSSPAFAQTVTSSLPDFLVTQTSTLPQGPLGDGESTECIGNFADPQTPAGQHVAERGWRVVSEAALGDFDLVSFAGSFSTGTSGSCAIEQSNVGVFEDGTLRAILYTASETDQLIGPLDERYSGDVRLWSGDYLGLPVADLKATAEGITVSAVASEETFCDVTVVPNIYDKPITEARRTLKTADWRPVPQPAEEYGTQPALHDIGITEAETCSGTGFGFCTYAYRAPAALLQLTTVGEVQGDTVPTVVDFSVTCAN